MWKPDGDTLAAVHLQNLKAVCLDQGEKSLNLFCLSHDPHEALLGFLGRNRDDADVTQHGFVHERQGLDGLTIARHYKEC